MAAMTEADVEVSGILPAQSLGLLADQPAFATLPTSFLEELARRLRERHFAARDTIVTEGAAGDELYLVVAGRAEVTTVGPDGPVALAVLGPGEMFGELALLEPSRRRQATVTALTPLDALSLPAEAFDAMLEAHPQARDFLAASAEIMLTVKFLKQAGPFTALSGERLKRLAARLVGRAAAPGEIIIRQGERGDGCFLIHRGRVEVVASNSAGEERRLAELGAGSLFGEAALLTDAPRNATVRALEPGDLLELRRADLIEVMGADRVVAGQLLELLQLRDRPRAAPGVAVQHRVAEDGELLTILKNPAAGAYYRLSADGWFVWQRLDGQHTLRDLTLEYLEAFKIFSPSAIVELIGGLAAAGFVVSRDLSREARTAAVNEALWKRAGRVARRVLDWRCSFERVDGALTRLYRGGVRLVYTRMGQAMAGLFTAAGLAVFLANRSEIAPALRATPGGAIAAALAGAYLFAIIAHEAGHAFTVKAFGREVPRAGVGWHWFGPIAFVDTSDMWLAGRWPRIAVSLAGPYANFALAGLAALAMPLAGAAALKAALCQFALVSYLMALFNFNPLLEYDGYYVLSDWLDRPNLRSRALSWLGQNWRAALRHPRVARGHWFECAYGLGAALYAAGMAVLSVGLYRWLAQEWLARLMPAALASALAWVCGAAVLVFSGALIAGELRGEG